VLRHHGVQDRPQKSTLVVSTASAEVSGSSVFTCSGCPAQVTTCESTWLFTAVSGHWWLPSLPSRLPPGHVILRTRLWARGLSDPGDLIAAEFNRLIPVAALPSTLVISPDGRIAGRVIGAVSVPDLWRLIKAAL
jgi:hypothetical protein